jgi:hypothetical protein
MFFDEPSIPPGVPRVQVPYHHGDLPDARIFVGPEPSGNEIPPPGKGPASAGAGSGTE